MQKEKVVTYTAVKDKPITLGRIVKRAIYAAPLVPLIVAGYCVGVVAYDVTKFALKHPRTTLAGVIGAGALWYYTHQDGGARLREQINHKVQDAFELVRQDRVRTIEDRLTSMSQQQSTLARALREQQAYGSRLEKELQIAKRTSQAIARQTAAYVDLKWSAARQLSYPEFYAYFLKPDESFESAVSSITGSAAYASEVRRWSGLKSNDEPATGQLLWIKRSVVRVRNAGLLEAIPDLTYILQPAHTKTTSFFTDYGVTQEVIALNKKLGLHYGDERDSRPRYLWRYK